MIADASVLILFSRAGHLALLRDAFTSIEIPEAVHQEVFARRPISWDALMVADAMKEGWIQSLPTDGEHVGRLVERFPNLGLGEITVLVLALDQDRSHILLDDANGRKVAKILGLRPIGCLGIVARAYRLGRIPEKKQVASIVRALVSSGLWISAQVVEEFWESLGGRP